MDAFLPKFSLRFVLLVAFGAVALVPVAAKADAIVGNFSIVGSDTFDATGISFSNAYVNTSTLPGLMSIKVTPPAVVQAVTMTDFLYINAPGTLLFTSSENGGTVTFTIGTAPGSVITTYIPAGPGETASVKIQGYGTLTDTGYDDTPASFSLTSSTSGATSFQVVGRSPASAPAVPEPSSLLLLGTGLLAGSWVLMRRNRLTAL